MARKPEATSTPPDTDEIDIDWNQTSSVVDAPRPSKPFGTSSQALSISQEAQRKALSTPQVPRIDLAESDDSVSLDLGDAGEIDASIPLLGQQPSGAYAIPLELGDDGEEIHQSDRPTVPQLEPPPEYMARASRPTPVVDSIRTEWGDEAPTPLATNPAMIEALRQSSSKVGPTVRAGRRVEDPEVTFGEEPLTLDDPGGINMEDSLELSLDNIPPAPFEAPPSGFKFNTPAQQEPPSSPLALAFDDDGDALDLVAARATPVVSVPSDDDPLVDLRDRYAVGDFTGAHEIAESILNEDPENVEALRFRESCRDVLIQMYTARLGSTSQVPRLAIPAAELQWLSLDHRAGFLLSCVDGRSTVEEILDVSGMPPLDALRILYALLQQQIIEVMP